MKFSTTPTTLLFLCQLGNAFNGYQKIPKIFNERLAKDSPFNFTMKVSNQWFYHALQKYTLGLYLIFSLPSSQSAYTTVLIAQMGTTNPAKRAMDSLNAAMVVYPFTPVHQAYLANHFFGTILRKYAITNPKPVTHRIHLIENIANWLFNHVQTCNFFNEIASCVFAGKIPFIDCYFLKMGGLFILGIC